MLDITDDTIRTLAEQFKDASQHEIEQRLRVVFEMAHVHTFKQKRRSDGSWNDIRVFCTGCAIERQLEYGR